MNQKLLHKHQDSLLIVMGLAFLLIQFLCFYGGYLGYDDLEYVKLAKDFSRGKFVIEENLYAYRWVVIIPLAIFYKIFGITDFSNAVITIIPTLFILYFTLKLLKTFSFQSKLIAVLFIIFSPIHLLYLEKPMPDIWVELGFLLCFSSYYGLKYVNQSTKNCIFQFIIGAIILFLSKESFLVIYPYFLVLFVLDIRAKQNLLFWKAIFLGLIIFLALYFGGFYLTKGNAFARLSAIFHNRYISTCSYDLQPIGVLIDRILYKLWLDLIRNGFLIPIGFLIVLIKKKEVDAPSKFILWSTVAMLLLSNFMTILYTSYVPLCNDARHFLFVIPLLAITFAIGIQNFKLFSLKDILLIVSTLVIQLTISVYQDYENTWLLYLPLIAAVLLFYFTKNKPIFIFLVAISLFAQYVHTMSYNKKIHYSEQKQLFEFIKNDAAPQIRIITDPCNKEQGGLFYKYDTTRIQIFEFEEFSSEMKKDKNVKTFIILNGMTAYLSKMGWEDYPDYVHNFNTTMTKVYFNQGGEVFLWKPE